MPASTSLRSVMRAAPAQDGFSSPVSCSASATSPSSRYTSPLGASSPRATHTGAYLLASSRQWYICSSGCSACGICSTSCSTDATLAVPYARPWPASGTCLASHPRGLAAAPVSPQEEGERTSGPAASDSGAADPQRQATHGCPTSRRPRSLILSCRLWQHRRCARKLKTMRRLSRHRRCIPSQKACRPPRAHTRTRRGGRPLRRAEMRNARSSY